MSHQAYRRGGRGWRSRRLRRRIRRFLRACGRRCPTWHPWLGSLEAATQGPNYAKRRAITALLTLPSHSRYSGSSLSSGRFSWLKNCVNTSCIARNVAQHSPSLGQADALSTDAGSSGFCNNTQGLLGPPLRRLHWDRPAPVVCASPSNFFPVWIDASVRQWWHATAPPDVENSSDLHPLGKDSRN